MTRFSSRFVRWALLAALAIPSSVLAGDLPSVQKDSPWFSGAQTVLAAREALRPEAVPAKNVILFVGDGMGVTTVTAARILEAQARGETGEENLLSFERFPYAALAKTYNTNQQTPDSAGTMTAMMTGVKTKAGVIGLGPDTIRGNCGSAHGQELVSGFALAEAAGKATGVVTTARLSHATPAATYARVADRGWENDSVLPPEAVARGCKDIARQLIEYPFGDGIEVAMGGGRSQFMPATMADPEDAGRTGLRRDGRDLIAEWVASRESALYVYDRAGFDAIDPARTERVLALFERSHMEYEADRAADTGGEPSLTEMTTKAIDILSKNDRGFFLMVEAGRIDHAHHAGNASRALLDTIELARAVKAAVQATDSNDTLIIVTADHGHVLTIAGYSERGNPILGLSGDVGADGLPYTTLGYTNGPGFGVLDGPTFTQGTRVDLRGVDTTALDFRQESLVPISSETHSGEDTPIYASGPGAHLFQGVVEQNVVFHVINRAAGLGGRPY
jgi:alkaline phosphatase